MTRLLAWKILRSGSTTPLRLVDTYAERAELDPRDRGFLRALVGTEVRRRATLKAVVDHFTRGKPSADLAAHLRLGVAQLLFLDSVPDHAAVSETVRAVRDTLGMPRSRHANAVLRAIADARGMHHVKDPRRDLVGRNLHLAEPVFRDPEQHPWLWAEDALSMPAAMVKRWAKRHGTERALELARAGTREPELCVRATGGDREALTAELAELEPTPGFHEHSLRLDAGKLGALLESDAFREGRCAIQGETALRAAQLVGARPGERVLDLCAAPGGKAMAMAGAGATVVASDLAPRRLAGVAREAARLGVAERVHTLAGDGAAGLAPDATFDAVLVDAPCSNTGVLAARPGARWRFGPSSVRELGELQLRLLDEAAARVAPGGRLVYSTCSLEPEENAQRVRAFLEAHPDWEQVDGFEALPGVPGVDRGEQPVDGGFAARLERRG